MTPPPRRIGAGRTVGNGGDTMASVNRSAATLSGLAVASLVLGLLGFLGLTALLGFILGIIALVKISGSGGRLSGQGMAIGGVVTSGCWLLMVPISLAILLPAVAKTREAMLGSGCQFQMQMVATTITQYAAENGGKLPKSTAEVTTTMTAMGLPSSTFECKSGTKFILSPKVAGKSIESIANPSQTVLLFESTDGKTAAYPHDGYGYVAYVDGLVRKVGQAEGKKIP